jgi:hypothetical protein
MKFEFNSLDELKEFLQFVVAISNQPTPKKNTSEITVDLRVDVTDAMLRTLAESNIGNGAGGTVNVQDAGSVEHIDMSSLASPFASGQTGGEPADATHAEGKRKRRTKAEIAADEAAKLAPPVTFDKPADPLDNLKEECGTPGATTGSLEASVAAVVSTGAPSDIDHLRRCREFISEHSMATYEKSFALADLAGKNIMAFTDADRAKHGAALDLLAANPGA